MFGGQLFLAGIARESGAVFCKNAVCRDIHLNYSVVVHRTYKSMMAIGGIRSPERGFSLQGWKPPRRLLLFPGFLACVQAGALIDSVSAEGRSIKPGKSIPCAIHAAGN